VAKEGIGHYNIGIIGIGISIIGSIIAFIRQGIDSFLFVIMALGVFVFIMITIVVSFHSEQKDIAQRIQNLEENLNIQQELTSIKSEISYLKGVMENDTKQKG